MSKSKQGGSGRAVALQYGPGSGAPVIVASGMGHLAERIVEVAVDSGVPVYEDNSLATILSQMELGREIPEELYQAIVDIYIYFLQFDPSDPEKYRRERRERLDFLQKETLTMIFYEAPHKLCATLRDLRDAFGGDRRLSLSRELTKLHEQTLRMTLDAAVAYFDANAPRGEFVLILEGAPDEPETEQDEAERLASAAKAVRRRVEQGQTQKDAVKAVSAETGVKKNALYRYVLDHEE